MTVKVRLCFSVGNFLTGELNRNVHVAADQEHALVLERVLRGHVKNQATQDIVMNALKKTLVIDRAYRAGLGFAMNQILDA